VLHALVEKCCWLGRDGAHDGLHGNGLGRSLVVAIPCRRDPV
jgi:hypothetical protein